MKVELTKTSEGFLLKCGRGSGQYDSLEEALDGIRVLFDNKLNDGDLLEAMIRAKLKEVSI